VRRGVVDTLKRGFDNTISNWPVIALRLAESVLFLVLAVGTAFLVLLPILVSVGIRVADLISPEEVAGAATLLLQKWVLLLWVFAAVTALLGLFVAIHSFVQAGCARVYVDADRIAGPETGGARSRFKVFSLDRWLAGGAAGWWTVFLLYNLAWGAAGLILFIPLLPTLILMIVFRETAPALIATGCIGLLITFLLMIVVGFVTAMWTNRSIAAWAARHHGARDALAEGWRALRLDLGRHLLVALIVLVVTLAGSAFFASFSFFAALGETVGRDSGALLLMTLPLRIVGSVLSSVFSAIVTSWYLASYSAIAVEGEG
jgi:hypothetical protein